MNKILDSFIIWGRMIKIEHSIFALPYAWSGMFLAEEGFPDFSKFLYLTLAMITIRSFAMTFNRLADLEYDKLNPRTSSRPLVTGRIEKKQAWIFCIFCILLFILFCAFLNRICFWLSLPAIIFAGAYSYIKRFSPWCHYWLGATLGLAPLAGWLAAKPDAIALSPLLLGLAVTFWVAAFDIYYAFQDIKIDQECRLHSLPADTSPETALVLAGFSHALTVIFLLLCGMASRLAWPWYVICVCVAVLLVWEHLLVKTVDLKNINMAFFTLNGIISPVILCGIILGIYL